jgi:hypothetical protein
MAAHQINRDDSDLSLPPVHPKTIQRVEQERIDTDTLYKRVHRGDPATALFIRRRAIKLAPENLEDREEIAKLALQAVEIKNEQLLINGLNNRLARTLRHQPTQAANPVKTDISLPPRH